LIASGTFGPEEIKAMAAAYEGALIELQLMDRNDPITELIADCQRDSDGRARS
jgi:hypothetical protein